MKRLIAPALLVLIALTLFWVLSSQKKPQSRKPPAPGSRQVQTIVAAYTALKPTLESDGRVLSRQEIALTPEVSGVVRDTPFGLRKANSFSAGQVLMVIDNRQAQLALGSSLADLQNALTSLLAELRSDLPQAYSRWSEFFSQLSGQSTAALPSIDDQREHLIANRYNVFKLYYAYENQRLALQKHTLRAPFNGTVTDAQILPGTMARVGIAVATIARTDIIEIELALAPAQTDLLKKGNAALVFPIDNSEPLKAKIDRIGSVLDKQMQTVAVFITVGPPHSLRLLPGSFVRVKIETAPLDSAFSLPRKALLNNDLVYIIEKGSLAQAQAKVLLRGVDTAYIGGGIPAGTHIVAQPLQDAVVGMSIRPVGSSPESATPGKGAPSKKPAKP